MNRRIFKILGEHNSSDSRNDIIKGNELPKYFITDKTRTGSYWATPRRKKQDTCLLFWGYMWADLCTQKNKWNEVHKIGKDNAKVNVARLLWYWLISLKSWHLFSIHFWAKNLDYIQICFLTRPFWIWVDVTPTLSATTLIIRGR